MKMKTIESKAEYEAKLSRVGELMDKQSLSESEERELQELADIIEAYENIHYPI